MQFKATETIFFIFINLFSISQGAKILFFFGLSTYSHRITVWPLVEALAEKDHSVAFLQPDVNRNPNPKVKEIIPNTTKHDNVDFLQERHNLGPGGISLLLATMLPKVAASMCEEFFKDPEIMKLINSPESQYDLVVIDALLNDCALGFAYKWKAKTIIFGTTSVFEWWPDTYGFPAESSWIPNLHFGYFTQDVPLPFFGRILPTLAHIYYGLSKSLSLHPKIEPLLREKLDIPDMPSLTELESNASLVLMNTHFSEELARSLPPLVVPIGGMHCTEKTKPLPKEIQDFINGGGKDGFIYVSFGSAAKFNNVSEQLRDTFFNAFKNTKSRFIWKWEGPRPTGMPSNIYTADWMPQQAILAHPKIRCFITHGGLLSMQEAVFNGVPMISFPIFAEQDYNAERLHRTKRGIRLEITSLTQSDLENAINKILTDDTYSKNVKKASIVFKDRPEKPIDTAVWWVEYVLRHDDVSHLRPLAYSQTWYQRRLLDVWAFIAAVIIFIIWLNVFILKKLLSCCSKTSSVPTPTKVGKLKKKQ